MPETQVASESPFATNLKRRNALGLLGLSGIALIASATPASALFFRKSTTIDHSRLPANWVKHQGKELQAYANYLGGLKLKHVTPQQMIEAHAKHHGSVWNTLPPRSLWKYMATTLKAVDRVAAELGQPVKEVISAYRSPAYNRRCAGAKRGSWHQSNVALDLKFSTRASTVAAVSRKLRARGVFRGGVGRYSNFTHIDTRGHNVNW